ncbi:MAG: hypothetical protein B7Z66_00345 [Chromatiales bacterium 21-64-14]|nr:MAG: hypothetical protein B7Z66_00345 [Chromatiales bacterium 21-64-14]
MGRKTSPGTGKLYGLERVCRALDLPRSTLYGQRSREAAARVVPFLPPQRGPKPKTSDGAVLGAIRGELAPRRSPARGTARSGRDCPCRTTFALDPAACCG